MLSITDFRGHNSRINAIHSQTVRRCDSDGSKIYVSMVYLWTGRCPEINHGGSSGTERGPVAGIGQSQRSGVGGGTMRDCG